MTAALSSATPLLARGEPAAQVQAAFARLRDGARIEPHPSAAAREDRLRRLERSLQLHTDDIIHAVDADFRGRARIETLYADVLHPIEAIRELRKKLAGWMKPLPVEPVWYFRPSTARVEYQPKGVVGILSPWNYPVNLALIPLAEAIAAGNRALLKPSELAPRTSELLARILGETFAADEVAVVLGGPDVARAVTELPLDHLIFTGSTAVGREVARTAAGNLVPATLELGGKSPVIISPTFALERAAERIAYGKLFNAGQTCIAPDYALVPAGRERHFADAFKAYVARQWGDLAKSPDYTAIATERHRDRLEALLSEAADAGARVVRVDPHASLQQREAKMAPALVFDPPLGSRLMQEEIFGPILPIIAYRGLDAAIDFVNARPRPLALYLFEENAAQAADVLKRTWAGGACVNDVLLHFAQHDLPFGGIGPSGMGAYHGFEGFRTLSHPKPVFAANGLSAMRFLVPPYPSFVERGLRALIGGKRRRPGS
ncbi:MAG: coniferyl aldehyde dehydrogenase [Deltaproteobacteria bacterium]|nr:coniferyl aldehyde dehydrogenase [Deltaproteobacteria bacterium]